MAGISIASFIVSVDLRGRTQPAFSRGLVGEKILRGLRYQKHELLRRVS
jgi:hypothetical protein